MTSLDTNVFGIMVPPVVYSDYGRSTSPPTRVFGPSRLRACDAHQGVHDRHRPLCDLGATEVLETHIGMVVLMGDRVHKGKKAPKAHVLHARVTVTGGQ